MATENNVRNFTDMERAMREHDNFELRSYSGTLGLDGKYTLTHWNTEIARIDPDGKILVFNVGHYSNTTSKFQGRIIRNALSAEGRAQLKALCETDFEPGTERLTKDANRMLRMIG